MRACACDACDVPATVAITKAVVPLHHGRLTPEGGAATGPRHARARDRAQRGCAIGPRWVLAVAASRSQLRRAEQNPHAPIISFAGSSLSGKRREHLGTTGRPVQMWWFQFGRSGSRWWPRVDPCSWNFVQLRPDTHDCNVGAKSDTVVMLCAKSLKVRRDLMCV